MTFRTYVLREISLIFINIYMGVIDFFIFPLYDDQLPWSHDAVAKGLSRDIHKLKGIIYGKIKN